jgi:hypothetical protein
VNLENGITIKIFVNLMFHEPAASRQVAPTGLFIAGDVFIY